MARDICIKTKDGLYCYKVAALTSRNCSCEREPTFEDPYAGIPVDPGTPGGLLEYLTVVLERWQGVPKPTGQDPDQDRRKMEAIAAFARLITLNQVDVRAPFVVTAMDG
jgi:hypothetical protein